MKKAVIFDMNGVIVDDEHVHEMAFRETVKDHGIDLTHEDYLMCCAGKTDKRGYEDIGKMFSVDLPIEELLKKKWHVYPQLFERHKKCFDGVQDLIHSLSKKYMIGLASSASRSEVMLILGEFHIECHFSAIITADDVQNGKLDPEPYLKTAEFLKVSPEDCVVIEDSVSGIRSAKAAGCYCIAITTTHEKSALGDADVVVASFGDIQNMINKTE